MMLSVLGNKRVLFLVYFIFEFLRFYFFIFFFEDIFSMFFILDFLVLIRLIDYFFIYVRCIT